MHTRFSTHILVLAQIKVLRWADFVDTQMFPDLNNYYEQNKSRARV